MLSTFPLGFPDEGGKGAETAVAVGGRGAGGGCTRLEHGAAIGLLQNGRQSLHRLCTALDVRPAR